MKLCQNLSTDLAEVVESFFSIYSPGGHFVQRSGTIRALLVLFLALPAILFNGTEQLEQFRRELPKEPSCEIMSKSVNRLSRSCLKLFFYL